jgi:hypothetical protein
VVFAFDRFSAQWALLTILPLEGALRFQAVGAIGVWAVVAPVYILRDVYASVVHEVPLSEGTVAYRLGLLLVIALFAGASARELEVQRRGLAGLADAQRRIRHCSSPPRSSGRCAGRPWCACAPAVLSSTSTTAPGSSRWPRGRPMRCQGSWPRTTVRWRTLPLVSG